MQTLKKQPGVYILTINSPEKIYKYVGQSSTINSRINRHKSNLKYNKHYNTYMQNAYNKHFNLNIKVYYCHEELMTILEQTWINIIKCEKNTVCLNQQAANRKHRYKLSETTKAKISKALKGNPQKVNKSLVKGEKHHNYIHTIYSFTNVFTQKTFVGTRKEFMIKINLHWNNCARLTDLIKGRTKTCREWTLTKNLKKYSLEDLTRTCLRHKIYIFSKNEQQFKGTVTEFLNTHLILKKISTHKNLLKQGIDGWSVRPLEE